MTQRTVTLFILAVLIATGCIALAVSKAEPKTSEQELSRLEEKDNKIGLSLRERVRLAKLKGQKKLTFTAWSLSSMDYVSFPGVDTALSVYTVVIAQPVAEVTYVSPAGEIVTNYKFKIYEVVSEPPASKYPPEPFNGNIRPELLPMQEGEFVVGALGGTATVDGVEVTSKFDNFEPFSLHKKYLLFLNFDSTKTVGGMGMGPLSALAINDDGTMQTLDGNPTHSVKRSLDSQFGNSVSQVQIGLRHRAKALRSAGSN